jgi:hypothetical protein
MQKAMGYVGVNALSAALIELCVRKQGFEGVKAEYEGEGEYDGDGKGVLVEEGVLMNEDAKKIGEGISKGAWGERWSW